MQLRSTLTGIALVVALASGLTACSDDQKAEPEKRAPTSASPTPTATGPVPPELPAAANGLNDDGAAAFVHHWFNTLTYAMKTGDVGALAQISSQECKTCRTIPKRIQNVYDRGWTLETRGWKVARIFPQTLEPNGQRIMWVRIIQTPSNALSSDGEVLDSSPRAITAMRITLRPGPTGWQVGRLEVTA